MHICGLAYMYARDTGSESKIFQRTQMMAHYIFTEFQRKLLFISVEVGLALCFRKQYLDFRHPCWLSQEEKELDLKLFPLGHLLK